MTQIEQIKAEIERLKLELKDLPSGDYKDGVFYVLEEELIPFINSLPAEQPSEELEKFIQDLIDKYPVNKKSVPNDSLNDYYQGLRFGVLQGAQWQKEQFVNKSCQWLKDNLMNFLSIIINDRETLDVDYSELIYEFKKAMEDEQ